MAKNKPKAEKIGLFLERWEGCDKAEDKVVVCHERKARCRENDVGADKW